MTEKNQIYRCNICGNITQVLHTGAGQLVCCGQNMELLEEKTTDQGQEKHVPVVTKENNLITVKVGSEEHPMTDDHFIEWIELVTPDRTYRKFLQPSDSPKAEFSALNLDDFQVRQYCNIHGLWIKK